MSADDSNPWESAANDRLYSEEIAGADAATTTPSTAALSSGAFSTTTTRTPSRRRGGASSSSSSSCCKKAFSLLELFHYGDLLMGLVLGVYLFVELEIWHDGKDVLWYGCASIAGLALVRGVFFLLSLPLNRWLSRTSSVLLGLVYCTNAILAVSHLVVVSSMVPPQTIASVSLVLMVLEGVRYALLYREKQRLLQEEINDLSRDPASSPSRTPWWWQRSHPTSTATEPLLSGQQQNQQRPHWTSANINSTGYHMDDGNGGSSGWWPFSSSNANRDDGSVDYASLNEDWASRSEQDPFWWTKDDNDGGADNNNNNNV